MDLDRESTKVRVCLDAKAKFQNVSMNDALLKGKLEMPNILGVLTQFRAGEIAYIGDLKKMFWQMKLHINDQKYHGVVFKGETYVFTRVCFGEKASSPLADESMVRISKFGRNTHPEASKALLNERYVDDLTGSGNDEKRIIKKRNQIVDLIGQFGFEVKEWFSNRVNVGTVVDYKTVLGCKWNVKEDTISLKISEKKLNKITKRAILSTLAEVWDPIGLTVGISIKGKLVLQSIVRLKMDWDEKNR